MEYFAAEYQMGCPTCQANPGVDTFRRRRAVGAVPNIPAADPAGYRTRRHFIINSAEMRLLPPSGHKTPLVVPPIGTVVR